MRSSTIFTTDNQTDRQTLLGSITHPLHALVMKDSVSVSGMSPNPAWDSAPPPTRTAQQLMLLALSWPSVLCTATLLENPHTPSVINTSPGGGGGGGSSRGECT